MDNYVTKLDAGKHWSLKVRRGVQMTLTDLSGGSNVGMVFYNPENLYERYNAPDTLKAQHTFKLAQGNCLYSDMGRIFASITHDDVQWHDTVCGNTHASHIEQMFGARNYQTDRNDWHQNGYDAFLVELEKYGLTANALPANINWFSSVVSDAEGNMSLRTPAQTEGKRVTLRFEMDTLVILHTCPHPLDSCASYPTGQVEISLTLAKPVGDDDECLNLCPENRRGFMNNALYYLGAKE